MRCPPDGDKELVEAHGGVNGDLAAKVVLDLVLFDRVGRHVGHQLGQERAGPEQGLVWVLLGPALDDEMGRVESDIISEFWK